MTAITDDPPRTIPSRSLSPLLRATLERIMGHLRVERAYIGHVIDGVRAHGISPQRVLTDERPGEMSQPIIGALLGFELALSEAERSGPPGIARKIKEPWKRLHSASQDLRQELRRPAEMYKTKDVLRMSVSEAYGSEVERIEPSRWKHPFPANWLHAVSAYHLVICDAELRVSDLLHRDHVSVHVDLDADPKVAKIVESPNSSDMMAAAGIDADTFRRIRDSAAIHIRLKGSAAAAYRYSPQQVDRLIAAAARSRCQERDVMVRTWARWSAAAESSVPKNADDARLPFPEQID